MAADVSISGANFIVAETGSVVTVTNEGNAELTTTPPPVHIVNVGIEKLVPTMEHCTVFVRLLARAALGTEITQYTTFFNGPKRAGRQGRAGGNCTSYWSTTGAPKCSTVPSPDVALHPLRRLHEPLSGLRCRRRPRLMVTSIRPEGGDPDTGHDKPRCGR